MREKVAMMTKRVRNDKGKSRDVTEKSRAVTNESRAVMEKNRGICRKTVIRGDFCRAVTDYALSFWPTSGFWLDASAAGMGFRPMTGGEAVGRGDLCGDWGTIAEDFEMIPMAYHKIG